MANGEAHIISTPDKGPIGHIEQSLPAKDDLLLRYPPSFTFGAIFTGHGDGVLFGAMDHNLMVWDRLSGQLVVGLEYASSDGK